MVHKASVVGYIPDGKTHEINTWKFHTHNNVLLSYNVYSTLTLNMVQVELPWVAMATATGHGSVPLDCLTQFVLAWSSVVTRWDHV